MTRSIAIAAGLLVSLATFTWLAGPLLETQFGTEALIVAYAGLAGAAGILTYVVCRRLETRRVQPTAPSQEDEEEATLRTEPLETLSVDQELDQLQKD